MTLIHRLMMRWETRYVMLLERYAAKGSRHVESRIANHARLSGRLEATGYWLPKLTPYG